MSGHRPRVGGGEVIENAETAADPLTTFREKSSTRDFVSLAETWWGVRWARSTFARGVSPLGAA
jgi:hypothetical protein